MLTWCLRRWECFWFLLLFLILFLFFVFFLLLLLFRFYAKSQWSWLFSLHFLAFRPWKLQQRGTKNHETKTVFQTVFITYHKKKPSEKYLNVEYNSPFNRRELITSSFKFWRVFQSLCKDETSLANHYQFSPSPKSNLCVWIVFVSFHVTGKTKCIHLHILTQHVCLVLDFLLGSSLFILWKWLKVTSPSSCNALQSKWFMGIDILFSKTVFSWWNNIISWIILREMYSRWKAEYHSDLWTRTLTIWIYKYMCLGINPYLYLTAAWEWKKQFKIYENKFKLKSICICCLVSC